MIARVRDWLTEPAVRGLDADSAAFTATHRQVLRRKVLLRQLFTRFYDECRRADLRFFGRCPGTRLEIGSGSSFLKEIQPDVFTSDVKVLPFVDLVARAERLPLADRSLRAIYGINVFHHLPDPRAFFREALRVLHPGGGLVLIEPYHGPVARMLFRRLHATEGYAMEAPAWETPSTGPMVGANQALSYVVFVRDRAVLEREFPDLEIVQMRPHTHLLYLLSGGVNYRQMVPDRAAALLDGLERLLAPLDPVLAIQHTIVLRRRDARAA